MRSFRLLVFASALSLAAGCALLSQTYRPPRASPSEAEKVRFPWGTPRDEAGDGGADLDAGTSALDADVDVDAGSPVDAGHRNAFSQPGMPENPPVIYVAINLVADGNPGGSPLLDVGALYAIDTVNWRILAIHH